MSKEEEKLTLAYKNAHKADDKAKEAWEDWEKALKEWKDSKKKEEGKR